MTTSWDRAKVLITGGTRGIGHAVAALLVNEGARVVVAGTTQAGADLVAARLNAGPGTGYGIGLAIDGTEPCANELVRRAASAMGGLTAVVNAAGGATVGHALTLPWDAWQEDWNLKFWGYFAVIRAAVPYLLQSSGVVVNVLGVTGKDPNTRLACATAINGALRGLTKILADDLAPSGIRVVAVNPGATDTDLLGRMAEGYGQLEQLPASEVLERLRRSGPMGRLPSASDIAAAVKFLLSDEAQFVTGTSIDVDGGAHRGLA
jgi:3-oxoacyl-[acyl-carrier protein] reductase